MGRKLYHAVNIFVKYTKTILTADAGVHPVGRITLGRLGTRAGGSAKKWMERKAITSLDGPIKGRLAGRQPLAICGLKGWTAYLAMDFLAFWCHKGCPFGS